MEDLANHISLESCGNCSNAMAALTEGSAGGLLSSEITSSRVPTTWSDGEGNTCCSVKKMRVAERPGGVLEPGMCGHLLHGNREIREFSLNIQSQEERPVKEKFCTTGMNGSRKSDNNIRTLDLGKEQFFYTIALYR